VVTKGSAYQIDAGINIGQRAFLIMNASSSNNVTIPLDSTYSFPTGTEIVVIQNSSAQVSFVATSGVTLYSSGSKTKLTGQYSGASLLKSGVNTWYLIGDLTA
jgi:hypothetical protein